MSFLRFLMFATEVVYSFQYVENLRKLNISVLLIFRQPQGSIQRRTNTITRPEDVAFLERFVYKPPAEVTNIYGTVGTIYFFFIMQYFSVHSETDMISGSGLVINVSLLKLDETSEKFHFKLMILNRTLRLNKYKLLLRYEIPSQHSVPFSMAIMGTNYKSIAFQQLPMSQIFNFSEGGFFSNCIIEPCL